MPSTPTKRAGSRESTAKSVEPRSSGYASIVALQKTFGQNLKAARLEAGLSQRGLADLTGISQRHISAMEMGNVNATIETIAMLSRHIGKTPAELLTATPSRKSP
jgi:predicted transcriptional regulator